MEFGEMKRNTPNWSNFCMLLRRAGFSVSAGLSCWSYYGLTVLDLPYDNLNIAHMPTLDLVSIEHQYLGRSARKKNK